MTNVRVPATWIAQGHHPRVCARHGEAATGAKPRSFHTKDNPWLLLLLLASPLILVIVSLALRKSVKGPVPTCGRCAREQQRDSSILVGTWVLATVLLTVTIAMSSAVVGVLFTVASLGGLVLLLLKDRNRVVGTLDNEQTWVVLRRVHPAYAQLIFQAVHQPHAAPPGGYGYGPIGAEPAAHATNGAAPPGIVPATTPPAAAPDACLPSAAAPTAPPAEAPLAYVSGTAAPAAYSPGAAAHHTNGHRAAPPSATILPASKHGRPTAIEHTLLGEQTPQ